MNTFTIAQIDAELRKLMKEKSTFVYSDGRERCRYNQGPPSNPESSNGCIFGQALQNLGVQKDELDSTSAIMSFSLEFLPDESNDAQYWEQIQIHQDKGMPWGELVQFMPNS